MIEKLRELEKESLKLNPPAGERSHLQNLALGYADRFYESLPDQKAYQLFDDSVMGLLDDPFEEDGMEPERIMHIIENEIVPPGLNPVSARHFGYIPGGGLASSAVGDFLAAVTNRYASVFASSPGAALLETRLIHWLCNLVGYGEGSGGYLASGGSIANLTAIVAARDDAGLTSKDYPKAVVYVTDQTHHCIDRGLNLSGLKECVRRTIPMDERFRMIPSELARMIRRDKDEGLIPWLVIASAGSTDTGAIDPLDEIGEIAGQQNLWYHIDAAYGGFFLLAEVGKRWLRGMEQSDSVVVDPHKGLFLPYGTGALLVKDVQKLASAHQFKANYMRDSKTEMDLYSPAEISPELSKHFRGLRMWIPLKLHGIKSFRSALQEKHLLAKYAWQKLRTMDDIVVGPEPQLSIFMFRWEPDHSNHEELNRELHQSLLNQGRVFLSTTKIDGKFYFRLAVLSVQTHLDEINEFLNLFQDHISKIMRQGAE